MESGSILLRKKIPTNEIYKKRIRVISSGGIEGEVKSRKTDSVNDMSGKLAYVKDGIDIKGTRYSIGTVFPVEIQDEDDIRYLITYPKTSFSVKDRGFVTNHKTEEYDEYQFNQSFNLIIPELASQYKFPLWEEDKRHKSTEWGCTVSKIVKKNIDASATAEAGVSGGFFGFFQAKAEISTGAGTSTIIEQKLEDAAHKHRVTYWVLRKAEKNSDVLLRIALEKISVCDTSKGIDNNYIVRFEKQLNYDDITINSVWVGNHGFKEGGGSPLRLNNQPDLQKFENALKDFKFKHTVDGYDIKRSIIDFVVMWTVNLNYAPKS